MTAYFDQVDAALHDLNDDDYDALRAWEFELVHNCSLASMLPGFPVEFREPLNRVVVRWGVYTAPRIAEPDFEFQAEHRSRLQRLSSDLHTLFHDVVRAGGLSDGPRAYASAVVVQAEEARALLAYAQADATDPRVQQVALRTRSELLEFKMRVPVELEALCAQIAAQLEA
jgi:hypothetical protein